MQTILVTGGLGYIGSHVVVELQQSGYKVVIIDDLSNSKKEVVTQISKITDKIPAFHQIDLKDKKLVANFFN